MGMLFAPGTSLLTKAEAKAMVENYSLKNNNPDLKDSHYVWFDLDDLQCYLDAIKTNPDIKANGVRLYFAAHTIGASHPDPHDPIKRDDYEDRLTVFFVPTQMQVINNKKYHLERINDDVDLGCRAMNTEGILEVVKDFGTLCPPHGQHKGESLHFLVYGN